MPRVAEVRPRTRGELSQAVSFVSSNERAGCAGYDIITNVTIIVIVVALIRSLARVEWRSA